MKLQWIIISFFPELLSPHKKKRRQMSDQNKVDLATSWRSYHDTLVNCRNVLIVRYVPRSAEKLELVIVQDAAAGVMTCGW